MMDQFTTMSVDGWDILPPAQSQQQSDGRHGPQQTQTQPFSTPHDLFLSDSAPTVSPSQLSLNLNISSPSTASQSSPASSCLGVPESLMSTSDSLFGESPFVADTSADAWSPLFATQTPATQDLFSLFNPADFAAETASDPLKGISLEQQLFAALSTTSDLLPPFDFSDSEVSNAGSFTPDTAFSLSPEQKPVLPQHVPSLSPETDLATLTTPATASAPVPSISSHKPYKVTKSGASTATASPSPSRRESDASSVSSDTTAPSQDTDSTVPRVSRRARKEPLPEIEFDPEDPIAAKRARNTLAARKSRARRQKQEEWSTKRIRELEQQVKELQQQAEFWKTRAVEAGVDAASFAK